MLIYFMNGNLTISDPMKNFLLIDFFNSPGGFNVVVAARQLFSFFAISYNPKITCVWRAQWLQ
jgi:hypothetical protein